MNTEELLVFIDKQKELIINKLQKVDGNAVYYYSGQIDLLDYIKALLEGRE